jgi:hypothetical protein
MLGSMHARSRHGTAHIPLACAAGAAALAIFAGCGKSPHVHSEVAVRVGGVSITTAALQVWMHVLAPERVFPAPPNYVACIAHQKTLVPQALSPELLEECAQQYRTLRKRTFAYLIDRAWVLGEGAELGIKPSAGEVRDGVVDGLAPPGAAGAEAKFAVAAALVERKLRRRVTASIPPITSQAVAAFFKLHIGMFERPERRYIDIAERLPSRAAARRFMAEVAAGKRPLSSWSTFYHEVFDRPRVGEAVRERASVTDVLAARAHVLVGPIRLNEFSVFEVTRIVPRAVKPLSRVRRVIDRTLLKKAQRRKLARYISRWRREWRAKTICRPGFVVQACSEYRGAFVAESLSSFT